MKKLNVFIEILSIFLIFSILFIFIFLVNINFYKFLEKNKELFLNSIKEKIGLDFNYKEAILNLNGDILFKDVFITDKNDLFISLGDVKIGFSLINFLLNQKNYLSFIRKIAINNFTLKIDNINKIKKYIFLKNNKNNFVNDLNLSILIKTARIVLNDELQTIFDLKNFFVVFKEKKGKISSEVTFHFFKNGKKFFSSQMNVIGSLLFFNTFNASDFKIKLTNLYYLNNKIKDQIFSLKIINNNLIFEKNKDLLPIDILFTKLEDDIFGVINISSLYVNQFILSPNKSFFIPDFFSLYFKFHYNLNESTFTSKVDFFSHYNSFLFKKDIDCYLNARVEKNVIFFDKFQINDDEDGLIKLTGFLPLFYSDFKIDLVINKFKIYNNKIDTNITLLKNRDLIRLFSDGIKLNNENLGDFEYFIVKSGTYYAIHTLKSFNGYVISAEGYKKDSTYEFYIEHNFNYFSISNIINAVKRQNNNIFLNGKILQYVNDGYNEIKFSKLSLINNKEIYNFSISLLNKVFYIDAVSGNNKIFTFWLNYSSYPLIFFLNATFLDNNFEITSRISGEKINININKNMTIDYLLNTKKIYVKSKNLLIKFYKNIKGFLTCDFVYDVAKEYISHNQVYFDNFSLFKNRNGNLKFKINLVNRILKVYDVVYYDNINFITGDLFAFYNLKEKKININGFLKDPYKEESYSINLKIENFKINSSIYVTNFDINKIIDTKNIYGYVDLRSRINGDIFNPDVIFQIEVNKGKYKSADFNFLCELQKNSEIINLKKAFLRIKDNIFSIDNVLLNKKGVNYSINGEGKISVFGLGKNLRVNYLINGDYSFETNLLNLYIYLNKIQLGFLKRNELVTEQKIEVPPIVVLLKKYKDNFELYDLRKDFIVLTKNKENIFLTIRNKNNDVLISQLTKVYGLYTGKIDFKEFPVNYLKFLVLPYVGIEEGFVSGNIIIKEENKEPFFYGKLNVYNGIINVPQYLQDKIVNVSGFIIADKNIFYVNGVNGQVKDALAYGYGKIIFSGYLFDSYEFHINADNVPGRLKISIVDAIGDVSINDLIISKEENSFNFIGDLYVNSADINISNVLFNNKKEKEEKNRENFVPINVVMNFKSGKRVNVTYPIIKAVLKPDQQLNLKYSSEENLTTLNGKIAVEKGTINYLNKNFRIENATFTFNENDDVINPIVNLQAYYKTKDLNKNEVKVYLNINDRLFPLNVKFSSYPLKKQEEIYSLLGLSYAIQQSELNNKDTTISNIETIADTTNYLGSFLLFSPFETKIKRFTNLDTFSFNTKFFGNIIKANIEGSVNIFDYLDETSITIGKYLFPQLYFETVLSLNKKKEGINNIFLPFKNQNYGLNLQLMLQLELENLSVGYTFTPIKYTNLINAEHKFSFEANFKF